MLTLSLVTPTKKLVTDLAVREVTVPAQRGELNILEGHAALMTTLDTGVLRYKAGDDAQEKTVAISWGYLEVAGDHVTVLAETAETPEEIDRERAAEARKHAEAQLGKGDLVPADFQKYQLKLQRSLIRIQLAGEGKSTTRTDH